MGKKCIFLDRDGVINVERGDYTYLTKDFVLCEGVAETIEALVEEGFIMVVVTNQAGISKKVYSTEDMTKCHNKLLAEVKGITKIYYSPYHPDQTESLSRKPDSLMFEKAIARFDIDPEQSWMIGDRERDLVPAKKLKIKTILVGGGSSQFADHQATNLLVAVKDFILT